MHLPPLLTKLLLSPLLPRPVLPLVARIAAAIMRQRIHRQDRQQARTLLHAPRQPADDALYFAEAYHGGVTYWDWIVAPGGGLWYAFCWPLVIRTALERLDRYPWLRMVLELDGHTYEDVLREDPAAIAMMRRAAASGRLEIANGTYAQPLAQTISGESNIRQFYYGLAAIESAVGVRVSSFLAGEPQFFPQAPQVMAGFGIEGVVFRTHWGPFGTDPAEDSSLVSWQGPDGTRVLTIPRYRFMTYDLLAPDHIGVQNAGLTGSDFDTWPLEDVAEFRRKALSCGIRYPFLCRSADPKPPESPLPGVLALTARADVRQVTLQEYFHLPHGDTPVVSYGVDDIPATIPWGLGGERLCREETRAEGELLLAERVDAIACSLGKESQEERLDAAWKSLLQAQHHDLHVCGPWHSSRHGRSMADIGCELAVAARQQAWAVTQRALRYLASRVDASAARGQALVVFNPSPWPRREYVEIPRHAPTLRLREGGEDVPSQVVSGVDEAGGTGFVLDLPPLGYRLIDVEPGEPPAALPLERAREFRFANPFYSARIGPDGGLYLEADGRCLITCGGCFTLRKDGVWHDSGGSVERIELVEQGPVRFRYLVQGRLADVPFRQSVAMHRDLPRIEFRAEFDFGAGCYLGPQMADHGPEVAYYLQDDKKLCANFASPLRRVFCDSPFLLVELQGPRMIGLSLLALEGEDGRGVALLHRGTPGYYIDREAGVIRNVLAWGPEEWLYASDDSIAAGRSRYTALRGRHVYEYAVVPFASRVEALRAAADYTVPCAVAPAGGSSGSLPSAESFLEVVPEEVFLTALFIRGGEAYARLWNASGEGRRVTLRSGGDVRARRASLYLEELPPSDRLSLRPWGIQTVRLEGLGPSPR